MKIGFDGRFLTKMPTGNGVSTKQLLENLSKTDRANDYTIYLIEDEKIIHQPNFLMKKMPKLHASPHLRFLFTFPFELKRYPVDIFHGLYTIPIMPYGSSTSVILTLPEFSWFNNSDDFPASRLFMAQLRMTTLYSIKRADKIITLTNFMKNEIVNHFEIAKEKVEVIPWGVNEDFLKTCSQTELSETKNKFGIKNEYIFTVGDLHPRKNLTRLIKAFDLLKEQFKIPHQLVISGKDLYKSDTIYRSARYSLSSDAILFTGYVSFKELRNLYQGAAVFVFPSLDEGFGLPVHEAMTSRTPVVSSNRGTLPEVAGDAAVFVDPLNVPEIAQAIFKVITNPELQKRLVQKGLDQIKSYSWVESCKKTLGIYEDLLIEKRG